MFLSTERNLIYEYIPLDIHNPYKHKIKFPLTKNNITIHQGFWGAEESMLLDILCDVFRKKMYQNKKPKKNHKNVIEYMIKINKVMVDVLFDNNNYTSSLGIIITYKNLVSNYPFLKKYSTKKFQILCEKLSNVKISGHYKYKYQKIIENYNWVTKKIDTFYKPTKDIFIFNNPQNFVNFEYKNINFTKHLIPKITDQEYKFKFESGLGYLLVSNISALEWEWISSKIYNMSKNAQNIFRKLIITKKKNTIINVSLNDLKELLNIKHNNSNLSKKTIEKSLEEIRSLGFISWERIGKYNYISYDIIKEKSNISRE